MSLSTTALSSSVSRRAKNEELKLVENAAVTSAYSEQLRAFREVPYALISGEGDYDSEYLAEMTDIQGYYKIYRDGCAFMTEGSNADYLPADLHYKMGAGLINKEARFLFAESPTLSLKPMGDADEVPDSEQEAVVTLNTMLKNVLDANCFEEALIKAAKDCFIGKRVACLVNVNELDGITVTFFPATQFVFETRPGNDNVITKFTVFMVVRPSTDNIERRIFRKRLELDDSEPQNPVVYLTEDLFDGAGTLLENVTPRQETKLSAIPACVFINDGLTGDLRGESEMRNISYYEKWFSRLSSADIDAQRKSMNPIKYVVDMDNNSTRGLSTGAGALWDLGSDQNLDHPVPTVGMLEPKMNYSDALKTTLDRIKTTGFEQIDMPNINLEAMNGTFTSGKAIKALYWPLIVRCEEKMKMWGPQLRNMVSAIMACASAYPECVNGRYVEDLPSEDVDYEIEVEAHIPIPEDEIEKKNMDLAEIATQTMSRKTYMQRWYRMTDREVQAELDQIALERQILEDSAFSTGEAATGLQSASDGSSEPSVPHPDQQYAQPESTKRDPDPAQSRDSNMPEGAQMDDNAKTANA